MVQITVNKGFKDVEKNTDTKEIPEVKEGAPPAYDSLYGKLQQAKSTSDGNVDFAKNAVTIVRGSYAHFYNLCLFSAHRIKTFGNPLTETYETKTPHLGFENPSYLRKPPSYDDMMAKVKNATKTPDGNVSYVKTSAAILCGLAFATIALGLMLGIPVASIVMGSIYLHDCPAERYIPIYLIVMGVFSIVKDFCSSCKRKNDKEEEQDGQDKKKDGNGCRGIIDLFLFAWFICGNVWIYRTYNHFSTDPTQPDYCHPTLFYFSFWLLNGTYIVIALACFFVCCFGMAVACFVTANSEIDCEAAVCDKPEQTQK